VEAVKRLCEAGRANVDLKAGWVSAVAYLTFSYLALPCLAFSHLFYCSFLTTSYFAFSLILSYPLLSLVACSALFFSSLIQYVHGMCVVLTAVYSLFSFFSEIHSISCVH
jgi:hypothetical protein